MNLSKSGSSKFPSGSSLESFSVPEIKITHVANMKVEISVPGLVPIVCVQAPGCTCCSDTGVTQQHRLQLATFSVPESKT